MSRTNKDKPSKLHTSNDWRKDYEYIRIPGTDYLYWIQQPTTKAKKRKEVDSDFHWMTTPGWFIRDFMNKPQRRQNKLWEAKLKNKRICTWHESYIDDTIDWLDSHDTPSVSRKPEKYYW